jgi:RNA recognition motif-containing protein
LRSSWFIDHRSSRGVPETSNFLRFTWKARRGREDIEVRAAIQKEHQLNNTLYVGNMSFDTTERDLTELFSSYGTVNSANVITDRETGQSRGFGFVEMASEDEAQKAIGGSNGKSVNGRTLTVNVSKPREGGGGGGGNRSGGGGGGNRGGGGGSRW